MSKKIERVRTHFDRLTVKVRLSATGNHGLYDAESLDPDAVYNVVATYIHVYADRSQEPAFLIDTPDGIVARTCTIFEVVECDRPAAPARPLIDVGLYAADCVNSMGDVFYDAQTDVDGYGPDELREEIESSVRYTLRKLMTALGHPVDGTATLRVPRSMADRLHYLRTEYARIDEFLGDPTLDPANKDLFEEQADIGNELAVMILDMIPTMEVFN